MIRRLDRYVLGEVFAPFFLGVLMFVVLFQVNYYMFLGKQFDLRNVPTSAVLKLIYLQLPTQLSLILPLAVSFGTSLGVSRLSRESEMIALRAGGTRMLRVVFPIAFFGLVIGMINFWIVDQISPRWSRDSNKLLVQVGVLGSANQFTANVPLKLGRYTVSLGSVQKRDNETLALEDVILLDRPEPGKLLLTVAKSGEYRRGVWRFFRPTAWSLGVDGNVLTVINPKEMVVNEKISIQDIFMPPQAAELGLKELKAKIDERKKVSADPKSIMKMEIQYHTNLSLPVVCLVFALVSPIFSIKFARKGGGFVGVLVSMVVIMAFFNTWVFFREILPNSMNVIPWVAAWVPCIIFGVIGLWGLKTLE